MSDEEAHHHQQHHQQQHEADDVDEGADATVESSTNDPTDHHADGPTDDHAVAPSPDDALAQATATAALSAEPTVDDLRTQGVSGIGKDAASIYVAYSADAGFQEKRFVCQLVRELKANGLADSVWFDKDEGLFESSAWVAHSLEASEKCFAALLILSESFFACPLALHALRTLAERLHDGRMRVGGLGGAGSPRLFAISMASGVHRLCPPIVTEAINADGGAIELPEIQGHSQAEQVAECSARLLPQLEQFVPELRPWLPEPLLPSQPTRQFASKRFLAWSVNDLQEWLQSIEVREYYRQQFAEQGVDGYLAYSLTDVDLGGVLRVDVQLVRKKITREILRRLQSEQRDSWSGRCRLTKPRATSVFLVCDPRRDVKTREALKSALLRRHLEVKYVEDMGSSRDDFLKKNGPVMAACGHVLVLLTESSPCSAIFYHCVMFAEWLGRRVIVLFLTNSWFELRPALRALLAEAEGLNFSGQPVSESLEELTAAITAPVKSHPSVVLEQDYLKKLSRKLHPAGYVAHTSASTISRDALAPSAAAAGRTGWSPNSRRSDTAALLSLPATAQQEQPAVFISYHWDSTQAVMDLRQYLLSHGVRVQLDTDKSPDEVSMKIMKGVRDDGSRKVFIEKAMHECHSVILAVTPKYLQSENCQLDLEAAHRQRRQLHPVLLSFCAWPPDASCGNLVRKRLAATSAIDISCERLAKQNMRRLLHRVIQAAAPSSADSATS